MTKNSSFINNLFKNSLILSLPGFISIFFSLIAIPIHLRIAGMENYGNYLLFHVLLSLSFLLNFGISKSIVISSNNNKKNIKKIAYEGIKYSINISLIIIFFYLVLKFLFIEQNINYVFSIELFFLGLIISIIYLTFEGIIQAHKFFKNLSLFNFIFYSISISLPSIMLTILNNLTLNELICFSVIIKFLLILIVYFYLNKKKLIIKNNRKILFKIFKKNSPWLTLNSMLIQFYEMLDKYLIKIFLGSTFMAIYSIPQQLTGKLSILSKGFSAFLLPNLENKKKINDFLYSLELFLKYIPIFIFILFPLYPYVLNFWLGNQYSILIHDLTKIFSLVAIFSCISHILITKYEADQISKLNFKIEIKFLPFFFAILLFLTINSYSLLFISTLILIKELVLIIFRLYLLKIDTKKIKVYFIYLLIFPLLLIFSFINMKLFYFLLISIIFFTLKNVKHNN